MHDCGTLKFSWIILTTLRENGSPGRLRRAGVLFQVRFPRQGNIYIYIYVPAHIILTAIITKHTYNTSGWWEHWFVTACETFSESKNKCNYSTRWPIFVQASHLTRSPCALHSTLPQLYEGHFKFRPHVRTVLVQLGRGIVSRIIILWYMEVFIWLQGSNVPYQA